MNRLLISASLGLALTLGSAPPNRAGVPAFSRDTIPLALAPLGDEHRSLRAEFDRVLGSATSRAATRSDRLALVAFLRNKLIPHAQGEEIVLYPALDSVLGTRGYATATLVLDHRAVARMTLELATLADSDAPTFQHKAASLAALVEQHFANEEDFVMPNLARKMNDRALHALLARLAAQRVQ